MAQTSAQSTPGQAVGGFFRHLFGRNNPAPVASEGNDNDSGDESDVSPTPTATPNSFTFTTPTAAPIIRTTPVQAQSSTQFAIPQNLENANARVAATSGFNACTEMQVGEERFIDPSTLPLNIGIPYPGPGYLLKRNDDSANGKSNYEAVLNIKFTPKSGESDAIIPGMMTQIARCYANLPLMEDENGRRLSLRLANPGENAPVRNISLTAVKMPREDMLNWSTLTSCRTIVHESFHLLGLVDLYPETSIQTANNSTAYDCRSLGPTDSVMRNTSISHFSSSQYISHSCSCNAVACDRTDTACLRRNSQCPKDLAALISVPQACPSTTDASSFPLLLNAYDIATNDQDQNLFNSTYAANLKGSHPDRYRYLFMSLQADPSQLLYPAEMRMVLSPGCQAPNQVYYQCAKTAYVSSAPGFACPAKPSICNDPKLWLQ